MLTKNYIIRKFLYILYMNSIVGIWTPKDLVLPKVADNVDFAQYFISESGTIGDIEYRQGNWLIYEKTSDTWAQANGAVLVKVNKTDSFPNIGTYTKVTLDNCGNVIGAGYLQEDDLPEHSHNMSSMKNVNESVYNALRTILVNAGSSPIKIIDNKNGTISLDVNIDEVSIVKSQRQDRVELVAECRNSESSDISDEELTNKIKEIISELDLSSEKLVTIDDLENLIDEDTIVVNKFGQLSAIPINGTNHEHNASQIKDLNLDIANVWATLQPIKGTIIDGLFDLSENNKVIDFINLVNAFSKRISKRVTKLENINLGIGEDATAILDNRTIPVYIDESFESSKISQVLGSLHNHILNRFITDEKNETNRNCLGTESTDEDIQIDANLVVGSNEVPKAIQITKAAIFGNSNTAKTLIFPSRTIFENDSQYKDKFGNNLDKDNVYVEAPTWSGVLLTSGSPIDCGNFV